MHGCTSIHMCVHVCVNICVSGWLRAASRGLRLWRVQESPGEPKTPGSRQKGDHRGSEGTTEEPKESSQFQRVAKLSFPKDKHQTPMVGAYPLAHVVM